jgi:hypothetical protein
MNAFQGAPAQYKPSTEPEEYAALSGKRPREPDHLGTPAADP